MASKARRQKRIVELVEAHTPASHHELRERLAEDGIHTTQATLSRDLHDLGIAKSPQGYVLPGNGAARGSGERSLAHALAAELASSDHAAHTVVLHTRPGKANALAIELDRARLPGVLGTIAGDDTILIVARSAPLARALAARLESLAESG